MWIAISLGISIVLSILHLFPIDLITIIGVFIGLGYYQRRRIARLTGAYGGTVSFLDPYSDNMA